MKNFKLSLITFLIALFPVMALAQHGHHSDEENGFTSEFTAMVEIYLVMKDHLVESNLDGAMAAAGEMGAKLEEIGPHRLEGEDHMAWMETYDSIESLLEAIITGTDLDEVRKQFRPLSEELAEAAQKFGVDGVVYVQNCPMAFDNEGGSWLSSEQQIANPYLPDTMLRCGRVIDSIE